MPKTQGDHALYGSRDPASIGTYTPTDVARYLRLPASTVRSWFFGQRGSRPVLRAADPETRFLSFQNLVGVYVLSALRREHRLRMSAVRSALDHLRRTLDSDHPLADQQMQTDGKDLFIEAYGRLISASEKGQLALEGILRSWLVRIERTPKGTPTQLYPVTRAEAHRSPRIVWIDPTIQFGRPCIARTSIPTEVIAERYGAGKSIGQLAEDYARPNSEIEEAIRYEFQTKLAA